MSFSKSRFALFMSLPLAPLDWQNLAASSVRLVQLPLAFCDQATLERMRGMGIRIVVRVGEGDYYDDLAPGRIRNAVLRAQLFCPIEAVIIGNEPENALDFTYGSNTFGADFAYLHRRRFDQVRVALQVVGINVVSPAQTMRSISEDEPPMPGKVTWREICCLPDSSLTEVQGQFGYLSANYNGVHLYGYGWEGYVDELRMLFALKEAANLWHKPLFVDEIGIGGNATPLQKMAAYIAVAEILLSTQDGKQHPLGQRVAMLSPFVSNGEPHGQWDARFLLRDPAAYALLGDWMRA